MTLVKHTDREKHCTVHKFARISPRRIKDFKRVLDRRKRLFDARPELRVLFVILPLRLAATLSWSVLEVGEELHFLTDLSTFRKMFIPNYTGALENRMNEL